MPVPGREQLGSPDAALGTLDRLLEGGTTMIDYYLVLAAISSRSAPSVSWCAATRHLFMCVELMLTVNCHWSPSPGHRTVDGQSCVIRNGGAAAESS